jgi:hypothetical protein
MQTLFSQRSPDNYVVLGYHEELNPETGRKTRFQVRLSPMGDEYHVPIAYDDPIGTLNPGTIVKHDFDDRRRHTAVINFGPTRISRSRAASIFGKSNYRDFADYADASYQTVLELAAEAAYDAKKTGANPKTQFITAYAAATKAINEAEEDSKKSELLIEELEQLLYERKKRVKELQTISEIDEEALLEAEYLADAAEDELQRSKIYAQGDYIGLMAARKGRKDIEDSKGKILRSMLATLVGEVPLPPVEVPLPPVEVPLPPVEVPLPPAESEIMMSRQGIRYFPGYYKQPGDYESSGAYEVMKTEYEPNPYGGMTQYEIRVSPSGIITKIPVRVEFNKSRKMNPLQRSIMRSIMSSQTKRFHPTGESRAFAKTIGGRSKIAAPSMFMGSKKTASGKRNIKARSRSPPRVAAGGGGGGPRSRSRSPPRVAAGGGLKETMIEEAARKAQFDSEENARIYAAIQAKIEEDRIKAIKKEQDRKRYIEFLQTRGIDTTGINGVGNLRLTARSTVLGGLGAVRRGPHVSGQVEALERTFDQTLSSTDDIDEAERATQRLRGALEYAESIGVVEEDLKGKIPDIGTPGRLLIDEWQTHGKAAAERLRSELIQKQILDRTGKPGRQFRDAMTAFEDSKKASKYPILLGNKGKKAEQIRLERSIAPQEFKDAKRDAQEALERDLEQERLRFISKKLGRSIVSPRRTSPVDGPRVASGGGGGAGSEAAREEQQRMLAAAGGGGRPRLSRVQEEEEEEDGFQTVGRNARPRSPQRPASGGGGGGRRSRSPPRSNGKGKKGGK